MPGRLRSALGVLLFSALLLAGVRLVGLPLARSGPSTDGAIQDAPLTIAAGSTFEQTFFVPACAPAHLDLFLNAAAGGTRVALTVTADRAPIGEKPDALTLTTEPGQRSFRMAFAQSADTWRRPFVLRGHVIDGPPLELRTTVPAFDWRGSLRLDGAWLGRRALTFRAAASNDAPLSGWRCAFDQTGASRSGFAMAALLLLLGSVAIVITRVVSPSSRRSPERLWWLPPFTVALSAGFVWLAVVPAYEGPDEVAHLQYSRFVALEKALPGGPPPEGSPWTNQFYEWVQPPLYYLLAATTLHLTDTARPEPIIRPNPASMLQGGIERSLYRHGETDRNSRGRRGFDLLRLVSWLMMGLTVLAAARALSRHLDDSTLAAAAASSLPLVPQWSAVLTTVSNDSLATMLATLAAATLLSTRPSGRASSRAVVAGILCGLALATKLTTAFLLPMGVAAILVSHPTRRLADGALMGAGVLVGTGWVFVRNAWVFGDPLASDFKRMILDRSGFVALSHAQPSIADAAFWTNLHGQLFEAFWARFGSLGVGPTPGSRLWWFFGAVSGGLLVLLAAGLWFAMRRSSFRHRAKVAPATVVAAWGTAAGFALWLGVNLAGLDDVVVHWTPRHLLPLSLPALWVAVAGLQALRRTSAEHPCRSCRLAAGGFLLLLTLSWLACLRHVMAQFHFGTI